MHNQTLWVEGEQVRLRRGVAKLLSYLVRHDSEIITKQDLIQNIWDGREVSDGAIYNRVSALRSALRDPDGPGRSLQWEYGTGLRFARVRIPAVPPQPAADPGAGAAPLPPASPRAVPTAALLNTGQAGPDLGHLFDGLSPAEDWQHLMGTYHTIYRTPSWPNKIKIGVSLLTRQGNQVRVWTTERGEDQQIGIKQRARYRGHAAFVDGRVFVFEQNTRPPRSVCLTTLDAPHSYSPNIMTGLMQGSSWRLGGAPYATRVVWRRTPEGMSLREAIQLSGPQDEGSAQIDDAIRDSLGPHCLTFRDGDHLL